MSSIVGDEVTEAFKKTLRVEQSELRRAIKEGNWERAASIAGYIAQLLMRVVRDCDESTS